MPYRRITDLPAPVRKALPSGAQKIYREAYNHAWKEYAERSDLESLAHRVAWTAVKKKYTKRDGAWKSKRRAKRPK